MFIGLNAEHIIDCKVPESLTIIREIPSPGRR